MFLLIDNYDSFTFNLVQAFQVLGVHPQVMRHDDTRLLPLASDTTLRAVVISPGPGGPTTAGQCLDFLALLTPDIPVLGVCLGHQILAHYAGYAVVRAERIMHGKTSAVYHDQTDIFAGLSNPFDATRYHSLIMAPMPDTPPHHQLTITARTNHNEPMGLRYQHRPWHGVQFHPESILSIEGPRLLENFLRLTGMLGKGEGRGAKLTGGW